jgi:hypothetical protein
MSSCDFMEANAALKPTRTHYAERSFGERFAASSDTRQPRTDARSVGPRPQR